MNSHPHLPTTSPIWSRHTRASASKTRINEIESVLYHPPETRAIDAGVMWTHGLRAGTTALPAFPPQQPPSTKPGPGGGTTQHSTGKNHLTGTTTKDSTSNPPNTTFLKTLASYSFHLPVNRSRSNPTTPRNFNQSSIRLSVPYERTPSLSEIVRRGDHATEDKFKATNSTPRSSSKPKFNTSFHFDNRVGGAGTGPFPVTGRSVTGGTTSGNKSSKLVTGSTNLFCNPQNNSGTSTRAPSVVLAEQAFKRYQDNNYLKVQGQQDQHPGLTFQVDEQQSTALNKTPMSARGANPAQPQRNSNKPDSATKSPSTSRSPRRRSSSAFLRFPEPLQSPQKVGGGGTSAGEQGATIKTSSLVMKSPRAPGSAGHKVVAKATAPGVAAPSTSGATTTRSRSQSASPKRSSAAGKVAAQKAALRASSSSSKKQAHLMELHEVPLSTRIPTVEVETVTVSTSQQPPTSARGSTSPGMKMSQQLRARSQDLPPASANVTRKQMFLQLNASRMGVQAPSINLLQPTRSFLRKRGTTSSNSPSSKGATAHTQTTKNTSEDHQNATKNLVGAPFQPPARNNTRTGASHPSASLQEPPNKNYLKVKIGQGLPDHAKQTYLFAPEPAGTTKVAASGRQNTNNPSPRKSSSTTPSVKLLSAKSFFLNQANARTESVVEVGVERVGGDAACGAGSTAASRSPSRKGKYPSAVDNASSKSNSASPKRSRSGPVLVNEENNPPQVPLSARANSMLSTSSKGSSVGTNKNGGGRFLQTTLRATTTGTRTTTTSTRAQQVERRLKIAEELQNRKKEMSASRVRFQDVLDELEEEEQNFKFVAENNQDHQDSSASPTRLTYPDTSLLSKTKLAGHNYLPVKRKKKRSTTGSTSAAKNKTNSSFDSSMMSNVGSVFHQNVKRTAGGSWNADTRIRDSGLFEDRHWNDKRTRAASRERARVGQPAGGGGPAGASNALIVRQPKSGIAGGTHLQPNSNSGPVANKTTRPRPTRTDARAQQQKHVNGEAGREHTESEEDAAALAEDNTDEDNFDAPKQEQSLSDQQVNISSNLTSNTNSRSHITPADSVMENLFLNNRSYAERLSTEQRMFENIITAEDQQAEEDLLRYLRSVGSLNDLELEEIPVETEEGPKGGRQGKNHSSRISTTTRAAPAPPMLYYPEQQLSLTSKDNLLSVGAATELLEPALPWKSEVVSSKGSELVPEFPSSSGDLHDFLKYSVVNLVNPSLNTEENSFSVMLVDKEASVKSIVKEASGSARARQLVRTKPEAIVPAAVPSREDETDDQADQKNDDSYHTTEDILAIAKTSRQGSPEEDPEEKQKPENSTYGSSYVRAAPGNNFDQSDVDALAAVDDGAVQQQLSGSHTSSSTAGGTGNRPRPFPGMGAFRKVKEKLSDSSASPVKVKNSAMAPPRPAPSSVHVVSPSKRTRAAGTAGATTSIQVPSTSNSSTRGSKESSSTHQATNMIPSTTAVFASKMGGKKVELACEESAVGVVAEVVAPDQTAEEEAKTSARGRSSSASRTTTRRSNDYPRRQNRASSSPVKRNEMNRSGEEGHPVHQSNANINPFDRSARTMGAATGGVSSAVSKTKARIPRNPQKITTPTSENTKPLAFLDNAESSARQPLANMGSTFRSSFNGPRRPRSRSRGKEPASSTTTPVTNTVAATTPSVANGNAVANPNRGRHQVAHPRKNPFSSASSTLTTTSGEGGATSAASTKINAAEYLEKNKNKIPARVMVGMRQGEEDQDADKMKIEFDLKHEERSHSGMINKSVEEPTHPDDPTCENTATIVVEAGLVSSHAENYLVAELGGGAETESKINMHRQNARTETHEPAVVQRMLNEDEFSKNTSKTSSTSSRAAAHSTHGKILNQQQQLQQQYRQQEHSVNYPPPARTRTPSLSTTTFIQPQPNQTIIAPPLHVPNLILNAQISQMNNADKMQRGLSVPPLLRGIWNTNGGALSDSTTPRAGATGFQPPERIISGCTSSASKLSSSIQSVSKSSVGGGAATASMPPRGVLLQ
ncbi:unnamed protein product [Amoebophrya sp. A120]|nr:unnamed protein product [Amoebophrya sp. A120]|eukprot:GSA120T00008488001.1